MGVLPLEFISGDSAESIGIDGFEIFDIENVNTHGGSNRYFIKKIDKIDLLKIDTEGYEFKVIKGLDENISKIKSLFLKTWREDIENHR